MPMQDADRTGRIVGGRNTTIEAHPYQIVLFYTDEFLCGGAILNASKYINHKGSIPMFLIMLLF